VQNHFKIYPSSVSNQTPDTQEHTVCVAIDQLQADIRDVAFHYRRKTGFPHIEDSGIVDVSTGKEGISITITINIGSFPTGSEDAKNLFKVGSVDVEIPKLTFNIRKVGVGCFTCHRCIELIISIEQVRLPLSCHHTPSLRLD